MGKSRTDKLLNALIDKLPPPGKGWPRAERMAWLQMAKMAFDVVYGREDEVEAPRGNVVSLSSEPRFYIAKDGRALRDPGGVPVKVGDVPGDATIWDERTDRKDLDTIKWADGTWPAAALPPLNFAG